MAFIYQNFSNVKNNSILNALRRFFSDTDSRNEKGEHIFNKWFDSFDDSKGYIDSLSEEEREEHQNKVFQSLKDDLNISGRNSPPFLRHRPGRWSLFYKTAAILVIGIGLAFAGLYLNGVPEPEIEPVAMVQKSNPIGQISGFTLPDGSTVWLSAASNLEYPEKFSETNRAVHLRGEAFFDIKHDPDRLFIVNSGPLSTRVLGTSFNIKAYRDDPDIKVTLATGSLEVVAKNAGQTQTLEPNQQVSFSEEKGLSAVNTLDASLANAWTRRELVFMRESFAAIAQTFERWYGVEFVFEDEALKDEVFVYHFKELSLQNSMIILKELADFEYEIVEGQTVIIKRKPGNSNF